MNKISIKKISTTEVKELKAASSIIFPRSSTETQIYPDRKLIKKESILDLIRGINDKLLTFSSETAFFDLCICLSSKRISKFSSPNEFQDYRGDTTDRVNELSLEWIFDIKTPEYDSPQRYTLRVRMGSTPKINEVLEFITNSGKDYEIAEASAHTICKVDYVNPVVAREFIQIVTNWQNNLEKNEINNRHYLFFRKHSRLVGEFTELVTVLLGIIIAYDLAVNFFSATSKNFNDIYLLVSLSLTVIVLFKFIGDQLGNKIFRWLDKISNFPIFSLTNGDKAAIKEIAKRNGNTLRGVLLTILVDLAFFIAGILVNK